MEQRLRKRVFKQRPLPIGLGLLLFALLIAAVWRAEYLRGPRYRGKTVAQWLYNRDPDFLWIPNDVYGHVHNELWDRIRNTESQFPTGPMYSLTTSATRSDRVTAIRHLGTNALPQLIDLMKSSERTPLEEILRTVAIRLPVNFGRWLYPYEGYAWGDPVTRRHIAAFDGFTILGEQAESALPALSNLFYSQIKGDLPLAWSIGNIGPKGVELLAGALESGNKDLRDSAALALGLQYAGARAALPALVRCVQRGHASYQVLGALGRIGCDDPRLVPELIQFISSTNAQSKSDFDESMAFLLLASYGERAHDAGPLAFERYRSCSNPAQTAGRRLYRQVVKKIAPDLWRQLPPPMDSEENADYWP